MKKAYQFILDREPAVTAALVQAVIILLVSFGVTLDDYQQAGILGFTAVLLGWLTRTQVTPTQNHVN